MNTVLGALVHSLSAVAIVFYIAGCGRGESSFVKKLHRSGEAALAATDTAINVPLITQFEWDTLFIFSPYTSINQIQTQLGYKWEEAERTGIDWTETFYLLVFTKDGKVVRHYKFPRTLGDFQNTEGANAFTKEMAIFEVKRDAGMSSKRLIFSPKRGG